MWFCVAFVNPETVGGDELAVFLFLFGICMVMALFQSVVYSLFPNHICLTISLFVAFFDFELYTDFTIQGNTVLVGTSQILEE